MRVKLLTLSAGAALIMALTACGGQDPDAPADPTGIIYEDPADGSTEEPYDDLTGDAGEQSYDGSAGEYEDTYPEPSYDVPDGYTPKGPDYDGVDDYPGQLSDRMYDNFQRDLGNYQGW
ncbi:hypothetical protein [Streptomyces justiciae]|uniref:Lipoprotein n=1 Tax=Streptomyces justiciae TaxID=2780140 RepID=A0ABU3M4G3_9ACTN|nr:hypothetical protein [Streptomyces justiciae]MDT7845628.1 hypothetical protein [Streptomyces justiciae]